MKTGKNGDFFSRLAVSASHQAGRPYTFGLAVLLLIVWAVLGPMAGWSDTWQLVINTGTTIVTFLMVFLIQNTQNRDTAAIQLKLDELIRINGRARNRLMTLEDLTEEELARIKESFERLADSDLTVAREPAAAGEAIEP